MFPFFDLLCFLQLLFVIRQRLKEEGSTIKTMVDRHTDKMIATLRQNAQHEKESLTKTLAD
jgi:hypothetical protein